ncbi:MAG: NINE protein [Chroococcales cyanobacterium]
MKSRITAALLAFFFGGIGIHKFYLGQNFAGILYLLFFWTFIPAIIAFFEFLGLLLMSDQAFDSKFNGGRLSSPAFQQSSKDTAATLGELKKLFDSGVITAEEYEQKRRKLLDLL